jgi:uncharacterized protein (TIGR01777 family)
MKITVTGATGLIGTRLVHDLLDRGDEVTVLSRNPDRARQALGTVEAFRWDPQAEPAPPEALAGREGVVHLAGENIAQRWNDETRRRIHDSREQGTRRLVEGIAAAEPRPGVLVSMSGINYYGDRGEETVDEGTPPGDDYLANVCLAWEREAEAAAELGLRVVRTRNGVVLDKRGGALAKMLPPFRLGIGGPVAGGRQYMTWIHPDDIAGMIVHALDDERWTGAVNAAAPAPVTNAEFSKALGRALRRPAIAPVPALAVRALYDGMAQLVTDSVRAVPRRAAELGYEHRRPDLDEAMRSALA